MFFNYHINHVFCKLTFTPKVLQLENFHVIILAKEMTNKYAKLINQ